MSKSLWPLLLFLCLFILSLFSCKSDQEQYIYHQPDPKFNSFIYAYSPNVISRIEPILIQFVNEATSTAQIGKEVDSGILSFNPSVKGNAIWENERTIKFTPTDPLKAKTNYSVSVALNKLFKNVPKDLNTFTFYTSTREPGFFVDYKGLQTVNENDLSKMKFEGSIHTSDFTDPNLVEKTLSASQSGNSKLKVNWTHSSDQIQHDFVIENVDRKNKNSKLKLYFKGNKIGIKKNLDKEIEIPAIGEFSLIDAQAVNGKEQYILLQFSDPLLKSQNLNGLIKIKSYRGSFRHVIDGNQIRVYLSKHITGVNKIEISDKIRNTANYNLSVPQKWELTFEDVKPQIRLVGKGVIIPESDGLMFPFEAINLHTVDVEIFKIFENNIIQFLQFNELGGDTYMRRTGRIIAQETLPLKNLGPNAGRAGWNRYAIDLNDLLETDPNAIYQIRLGFKPEYSNYQCDNATASTQGLQTITASNKEDKEFQSIMTYRYNWNYANYRYNHRYDPCYPPYYQSHHFVAGNVVASDLGIVAKRGNDGSVFVAVSHLKTTQPQAGTTLEFYDYQQQLIKSIKTDGDGIANTKLDRKPFVLIAEKDGKRGYVKMDDGSSLSLSRFDVSGTKTQKGLKGFIYGERGVWRPGDSIYLNFVLEDKLGKLPANHPVQFEFFDPRGQLQQQIVRSENVNNVYSFYTATSPDAPTGNWQAKVTAGGAVFNQNIKVETVKPNRLKIKIDFGKESLTKDDLNKKGSLQVNWLHGAVAKNLRAKIEAQLSSQPTEFTKFPDFVFNDPARKINMDPFTLFDGKVNENGQAQIPLKIDPSLKPPGKLKVFFKTRAFEKGGDFSSDQFALDYNPYHQYAGVSIPKNKYGSKRLAINEDNKIAFTLVDEKGNALKNKSLNVGLYRINWRWWWDRGNDRLTSFNSAQHHNALKKETITTSKNGRINWNVKPEEWGRYLVRVCDPESGHCSGDIFYSGYPWNDEGNDKSAAAMLVFSSDKKTYKVGETVKLKIPTAEAGKVLVSIENGSRVIESYWTNAKKGETNFSFYATKEMAPNVYANITYVQAHGQMNNDLPMRMYGLIPIKVEDPKTRLNPIITMPESLRPEQEIAVEVKEKNGKAMAYTIALVDEGLLDLTRFKTPDPHQSFYAREALGVKTWDIYDYVLGAYGGSLERILSIGGDAALGPKGGKKANRFKPVVRHLGPFYLEKGKKAKHNISIPNYVGSVRTMVVASHHGAYGMAEKTTPVKKPLMILATLPRVLGPGETLRLPVDVFAMENKVKSVRLSLETNGLIEIVGNDQQSLSFSQPGDQMANFNIRVKEGVGVARIKVKATGAGENASQEIEIQVRNPNPFVTNFIPKLIPAGDSWSDKLTAVGMKGTNSGYLEVSNIPPIDLGRRLGYLLRYPHGCIEQTTSSGFPQLYVNKLLDLDEQQELKVESNVKATLERLKLFQTSSGGFAYWPGNSGASHWGSSYAGHFILEAKKLGYTLPPGMLNNWIKYQKKVARTWDPNTTDHREYYGQSGDLSQSYRLYTLALAGKPELGAMNRLRERKNMSPTVYWRLAATYALAGKTTIAKNMIKGLDRKVKAYQELSYSYGSDLRDQAMILETLTILKNQDEAGEMVRTIAERLSAQEWMSTQTTAYCLLSIGKFVGDSDIDESFKFQYRLGNDTYQSLGSDRPIIQVELTEEDLKKQSFEIKNTTKGMLYSRLVLTGQPLIGDETEANSKLNMAVVFKDMEGKKMDPSKIAQGVDFIAEVSITNPGTHGAYKEMALSQIFPSGWEVHNARMDNITGNIKASDFEYQDIRDDRVYTYFDINSNKVHTYRVQLNAAYQGRYYLPTISCDAMYDKTIHSRRPGQWVEVVGIN